MEAQQAGLNLTRSQTLKTGLLAKKTISYHIELNRKIYQLEMVYSKTCVIQPLSKRQKIGCQDQLSLNAGQKY